MPWITPCRSEESALSRDTTFESQRFYESHLPTMQPNPRGTPVSPEELRATQARLHRLLVEAQDRLARERGLTRTATAETPRTNGEAEGSAPSDDKPKTNGEPDSSDNSGSSGDNARNSGA